MTRLESNKRTLNKSSQAVFDFLSDVNNFEKIMPDRVVNWQSTTDNCSFSIQGTADLGMRVVERKANSLVKLQDEGKVPFSFEFLAEIDELEIDLCTVQLIFNADLNPMLKMMASGPMTNFLNMLVDQLAETEF